MRASILLLCAVAYPNVASAGPCAIQSLSPGVLVNAPVSPGGGVIVALVRQGFRDRSAKSAVDKAWRYKDVNALVEPAVQDIAPGLAVYALPPTGGPELTLLDGDGTEMAKVVRASKASPALEAPVLTSIVYETFTYSMGRRGSATSVSGIVEVDAIPASAAALIVYEVTKTGNVATSWTALAGTDRTKKSVVGYQSGGRCNPGIPGVGPIAAGSNVVVAWLDSSGRLSPVSKPVVAKATTRKQ